MSTLVCLLVAACCLGLVAGQSTFHFGSTSDDIVTLLLANSSGSVGVTIGNVGFGQTTQSIMTSADMIVSVTSILHNSVVCKFPFLAGSGSELAFATCQNGQALTCRSTAPSLPANSGAPWFTTFRFLHASAQWQSTPLSLLWQTNDSPITLISTANYGQCTTLYQANLEDHNGNSTLLVVQANNPSAPPVAVLPINSQSGAFFTFVLADYRSTTTLLPFVDALLSMPFPSQQQQQSATAEPVPVVLIGRK